MKEFDVNKIVHDVQTAIDESGLHELHTHLRDAFGAGFAGSEIDRSFTVGQQPSFTLTGLHAGDVLVETGTEQTIRVRYRRFGSDRASSDVPFEATQTGSSLEIHVTGRSRGTPADYQVTVPVDCTVAVRGIHADTTVSGVHAPVDLDTVGGDINIENTTGPCSIKTVNGDINGSGLRGTLQIHTTSGDTNIVESHLHRFTLHSVSGDFDIETDLTNNEQYLVSTTSGDLQLRVPSHTGLTAHLKTFSGDVNSSLPTEVVRASKRNWQGRINGGGAFLEMSSTSGDLTIEPSMRLQLEPYSTGDAVAGAPPAPTAEPETLEPVTVPGTPLDEASVVLAALERGEISVDEAMKRLDGER